MSSSWLDQLEARLEQQLQAFLEANPLQDALLADQEARDRRQALLTARQQLRDQAEQQRRGLLELAEEIRLWQQRIGKARAAGAQDLVKRAEAHVAVLMERGRQRWETLAELGLRHRDLERDLLAAEDLAQAWSHFETDQDLEELRRRMGR
ncbi:MAG: hercynine metabolism protein [Cyanobacteriota bacterium]|nr:hercynine metabolism protein [Cyanobacteriota bacterium]